MFSYLRTQINPGSPELDPEAIDFRAASESFAPAGRACWPRCVASSSKPGSRPLARLTAKQRGPEVNGENVAGLGDGRLGGQQLAEESCECPADSAVVLIAAVDDCNQSTRVNEQRWLCRAPWLGHTAFG